MPKFVDTSLGQIIEPLSFDPNVDPLGYVGVDEKPNDPSVWVASDEYW